MRRHLTILTLLMAGIHICSGQDKIILGTDPGSIMCFKELRMETGYAFSSRWSANAELSINIKGSSKSRNNEEVLHWKELYDRYEDVKTFREDFITTDISFCYWPGSVYSGPVLCVGGCVKDRTGPDLSIGAGYYCRIWKGLRAGLSYRIRLAESIKNGKPSEKGIKLTLGYVF